MKDFNQQLKLCKEIYYLRNEFKKILVLKWRNWDLNWQDFWFLENGGVKVNNKWSEILKKKKFTIELKRDSLSYQFSKIFVFIYVFEVNLYIHIRFKIFF